jgi:hypothetical protein
VTDLELLKKANSFHVFELQTIVLFANKAVGKKVGAIRSEAYNRMTKEQGGSRKNHRAVKIGLSKCFTMDPLQKNSTNGPGYYAPTT